MSTFPKITEAELVVMKAVWKNPHCTANDIVKALEGDTDWNPRTIKTFISRLVDKKMLGYNQEGKNFIYYPIYEEKDFVEEESKSFLKKFFNGSLKTMLVSFMDSKALPEDEISELKKILDERK